MLCVGRVKDSPIADLAFDVAIAIQSGPDDSEKVCANNITLAMTERDRGRAGRLL
jgi:hypothetical protein